MAVKKPRVRKAETVRERTNKNSVPKAKRTSPGFIKSLLAVATTPFVFLLKPLKRLIRPVRFLGRLLVPKYVRNSVNELKQVDWPSGHQTWKLTFAVLIFASTFGFFIVITDYGLDKIIRRIVLR